MSYTFKGQHDQAGKVVFQPFTQSDPKGSYAQELWFDAASKSFQFGLPTGGGAQAGSGSILIANNITPVTATNPTSATNLMGLTAKGGLLNVIGKGLYFAAWGVSAPVTSNSTVTISAYFGTSGTNVSLFSFASGSVTAGNTLGWNVEGFLTCASTGSSGTLETHASGIIMTGTGATSSSFVDSNAAVTSAIDLTIDETLQFQATIGTGNASSTVVQRGLQVWTLN